MSAERYICRRILLLLLACCLCCAFAEGDTVVLKNGESLSGTFSRIRQNTLVFRTSLHGQLLSPMADVTQLSVSGPLYIAMTDGRVFYGRLGLLEEQQAVFPISGAEPFPINPQDIDETLPIPSLSRNTPGSDSEQPGANATVEWVARTEDGSLLTPRLRLDLRHRNDLWDFQGDIWTNAGLTADSEEHSGANLSLADTGTGLEIAASYERDMLRRLDTRLHLALGIYRELYASDTGTFIAGFAGAGIQYARGDAAHVRNAEASKDGIMRLGLRFFHFFSPRHSISESLTFYPLIGNTGEYRARSETVYSLPITERLHLRLDLVIDYESDPVFGGLKKWNAAAAAGISAAF